MIKAIFFDIDGTLVSKNEKILASTKRGIAQAQAKGIICGIATGRGPVHLKQQTDELNLDVFVTYNGQLAYTNEEVFWAEAFSKEVLTKIVSFSDQYHRQIIFGSNEEIAGSSLMRFGQMKGAKKLVRFLPRRFPMMFIKNTVSRFSFHRKEQRYHDLDILTKPIYQCVLLSPESEFNWLQEQLPECRFTRSNPYTVDIIPAKGSKLLGIEKFVERFDLTLDQVMVFGDSWNDLEMLDGAGIGVAMGNAEAKVKAAADFVTKTNDEDGIYYALKHYGIVE